VIRVLVAVAACALIAAASVSPASSSSARTAAWRACLTPHRPLLKALKASLTREARGRLGRVRAAKAHTKYTVPRGLASGVYFVSADIRGFGVATWAASASEYKTGGGLLIAVDSVARVVSTAGTDIPRSTLSRWGLTPKTKDRGYAISRRCVKR